MSVATVLDMHRGLGRALTFLYSHATMSANKVIVAVVSNSFRITSLKGVDACRLAMALVRAQQLCNQRPDALGGPQQLFEGSPFVIIQSTLHRSKIFGASRGSWPAGSRLNKSLGERDQHRSSWRDRAYQISTKRPFFFSSRP